MDIKKVINVYVYVHKRLKMILLVAKAVWALFLLWEIPVPQNKQATVEQTFDWEAREYYKN